MDDNPLLDLVSSFLGPLAETGTQPTQPTTTHDASPGPTSTHLSATNEREAGEQSHKISMPSHATVIVFSKDRPWQLRQLLRSMMLTSPRRSFTKDQRAPPITIDIVVIARVEDLFANAYQTVEDEFAGGIHDNGEVTFLHEDDESDESSFEHLLESTVAVHNNKDNNELLMFLTDDCLLLEPIDAIISCAASCLSKESQALGFITRLHPAISWCQTRGVPCPPPRDEMRYVAHEYARGDMDMGAYVFDRKVGIADWSYPFDLSGGIYRKSDVVAILDWIREKGNDEKQEKKLNYSHPNRMEISGNVAISEAETDNESSQLRSITNQRGLNAASTHPFLVILSINRVQDVCSAPLALSSSDNNSNEEHEPAALLKLLNDGRDLDIDAYQSLHFNSSHVGDLLLVDNDASLAKVDDAKTAISVLVPVHKGPPKYARYAIKSILMQPIEERDELDTALLLSPMQIVLVDDRCSDGSVDEMIYAAMSMAESNPDISLTVRDMRPGERQVPTAMNPASEGKSVNISIDIVASERSGIASALNYGLRYCKSDIVARMDADDVSCPRRLLSQVLALRLRPDLDVVGASSLLFCTRSGGESKELSVLPYADQSSDAMSIEILRPSLPSSDPGFVAWAMLFTCCLSHPSVVFRKSAIEVVGGYDESISRAEDYHLWTSLLKQSPRSIASLPNIGLYHRKHPGSSTSGANSAKQNSEGNEISLRAMQVIRGFSDAGGSEPCITTVATLKKPDDAVSASNLDDAAKLLIELESSFLQRNLQLLTEREVALIRLDCNSRIGELATVCIRKFGRTATSGQSGAGHEVWDIWCDRCPDKNLERISLLCHSVS